MIHCEPNSNLYNIESFLKIIIKIVWSLKTENNEQIPFIVLYFIMN